MSYRGLTDFELLELMSQDDENSFREVYDRYWQSMLSVAYHKTEDMLEAEEIVQTVLISLWQRRYQLQLSGSLNNYLAAAVKYKVIRLLAERSRFIPVEELAENASGAYLSNELEAEELERELAALVSSLPERCRLVYQMSRVDGLSNRNIAVDLGVSEKAVEAHITRALKVLRAGLRSFRVLLF